MFILTFKEEIKTYLKSFLQMLREFVNGLEKIHHGNRLSEITNHHA